MKEIFRRDFGNGLVLLAEDRPNTKKAALFVGVGVGSVNEDDRLNGGSHFNEHLLFKSNQHRTAREIIEDLEYSGSIVNACTTWKYTGFYAKTPQKSLQEAVRILFEAATNLDYDEKEFELERQVILTEIQNFINSPEKHALTGLFIPTLFSGTPLKRKIEGTVGSMGKIRKRELESFKKRYYVPSNMVIAVCGRFDRKKLEEMVGSTFGTLKRGHVPRKAKIQIGNRRRFKEEKRSDINQCYMHLGYRVPGFSGRDFFPLEMLSSLLSEGMSSRMFHELRETRGIGYSVGNFFYPNGDEGMFISHADGFDPRRTEEAKDVILTIFDDLKKNKVGKREFNGTKKLMISHYDDVLEKITERSMMMFLSEFFRIPFDFREKEKHIKDVSREDILEAAREYLLGEYVLTLLSPG
ncbi:MAG: insulinase family protein [Candidatus Altiarchaeota archaeon]|nr:insulinase family protein [Candidatus Altiarchaeota archaeon]